jgi:hypothetical protein
MLKREFNLEESHENSPAQVRLLKLEIEALNMDKSNF